MKIIKIPKKKTGAFRTIYIPSFKQKRVLNSILSEIEKKARKASDYIHGFTRFRSCTTNATAHVGHKFTTCFDLKDFFDTVTEPMLKGKLKAEELALVLVDGAPRQGLPTSPAVANLAASDMDKSINNWKDTKEVQFIYTRYADDLTFSYDEHSITELLLKEIPKIVRRSGFKINLDKTRTMSAKSGRRIITGVAVDDIIHPTRKAKRKLRAALHQNKTNQARGLAEWCQVKLPIQKTDNKTYNGEEVDNLCKVWKIRKLPLKNLPVKSPEENIGENCIVTPDPIYMLGMSNWTTGWKSCATNPSGKYHLGVCYWLFLEGTRIATYLSNKTMIVAGVERKLMKARALVHELENGVKVYDRVYPGNNDAKYLGIQLQNAGYIPVSEAKKLYPNIKVKGEAPSTWKAWFDNLKSTVGKALGNTWKGREVRWVHL